MELSDLMGLGGLLSFGGLLYTQEYPLWVCVLPVVAYFAGPMLVAMIGDMFFGSVKPASSPRKSVSAKKKDSDKNKPKISIVFGSQTGTAELYAKNLGKEATKLGFKAKVEDIADFEKETMSTQSMVVFIVSTYGEGEPTDTSKDFYDWVLSEDRIGDPEADLAGVNYTVFGLGDSQYKHFNQMGVEFDQRLGELGGKRLHPLAKGDADQNMEETFDTWKAELWQKATAMCGLETKDEFADAPEQALKRKAHPPPKVSPPPFPVTASSLPPSQKLPCWGVITRHDQLLKKAEGRSTLHIDIDCSESALPAYEAGDHLGILPANADALVDEYLAVLDVPAEAQAGEVYSLVSVDGLSQRNHLPNKVDTRTGLKWYLDLQGVPKKSVLRSFSHYTADPTEQAAFRDLLRVNDESTAKYRMAVKKARTILGFLKMFPSTKVPVDMFFELMPRTQPRWYSIASDSLQIGKTVSICIAISDGGLCSQYLDGMRLGMKAPVFIRKSTFHLPTRDKARPMIMIGPGTGVAPMIGFLHRRKVWQDKGNALGPCRFYFGCRSKAEDYIYEELMEESAKNGVITDLRVAFSRDQEQKVYVQHLLEQDADALWEIISKNGNIYICGDAKNMARQVEEVLVKVLMEKGAMARPDAEAYLNRMEKSQRYLKDVWTSH
eukprot:TRINITY_DN22103_c0_g1_i1.p1 TRINITY_DN22103_c0_g1~~TRINITY_DN22103_c0_g1_i1.p1  ORF type:complete len:692 (+),score=322.35 TRINITY_DN22103_c0_g1_i1:85-2076(+)